jgi:hypothetical protein
MRVIPRATHICAAAAFVVLAVPAAASAKDRDHDHMPDSWEAKYGLNTHKNDARGDRDHDGLSNIAEFRAHTNPDRRDTDRDGINDRDERAGTIASFDTSTGVLTINLFGGGTLSGTVNSMTRIDCDQGDMRDNRVAMRHGADDNSGPGNSGDDNGDRGDDNDANDDRGNDNANCTTADLTTGKVVREADVSGSGTATIFKKVELAG